MEWEEWLDLLTARAAHHEPLFQDDIHGSRPNPRNGRLGYSKRMLAKGASPHFNGLHLRDDAGPGWDDTVKEYEE